MPAQSKSQQRFFGVVKAMQKGDIPKKGRAGKIAKSMSKDDVDDFASTKHKGKPEKVFPLPNTIPLSKVPAILVALLLILGVVSRFLWGIIVFLILYILLPFNVLVPIFVKSVI